MAGSTLTVRTLALATVALVLACGHAVKAMGAQRAAADRAVSRAAPSVAPIRVIPAGSGHSTVATFSNSGRGGGSSSSRVATFTSAGGSGSHSIVTIGGDRVERRGSAIASRPQPQARAKPKGGILPVRGDPPVIAVRRGTPPQQPAPDNLDLQQFIGPPAPQPVQLSAVVKPKQQQLRNAFGGLATAHASIEPSGAAPLVYAHAAAK